jgi:hypothetical protein
MAPLIPEDIAEPHQGPWYLTERATLNKLAVVLPESVLSGPLPPGDSSRLIDEAFFY